MRKTFLISIGAFLILGLVGYLAAAHFATSKFTVKNAASVPVTVKAHWREETKDLGELAPGALIEFEVTAEAAMEFRVTYPNGQVASSSTAVYFTSGTINNAVITDSSVDVSSQL